MTTDPESFNRIPHSAEIDAQMRRDLDELGQLLAAYVALNQMADDIQAARRDSSDTEAAQFSLDQLNALLTGPDMGQHWENLLSYAHAINAMQPPKSEENLIKIVR